jgi:hypothetical protein
MKETENSSICYICYVRIHICICESDPWRERDKKGEREREKFSKPGGDIWLQIETKERLR